MQLFSRLLHVLSGKDNLLLFLLAKNGLKSTSSTPAQLGLTKKQYYTRLKHLLSTGLLSNSKGASNTYCHTTLGRMMFHNHVMPMMQEVKNVKSLMMLDTLKEAKRFTESDIDTFAATIFEKMNLRAPTTNVLDGNGGGIKVVLSEREVVQTITNLLKQCQVEIAVATRTQAKPIMQQILEKAKSGVPVKLLVDVDFESYLGKKFEYALTEDLRDVTKSIGLQRVQLYENIIIRKARVPLELILLDDRILIIGLIDRRNIEKFNAAIIIENMKMTAEMREYFLVLWKDSSNSTQNVPSLLKSALPELVGNATNTEMS